VLAGRIRPGDPDGERDRRRRERCLGDDERHDDGLITWDEARTGARHGGHRLAGLVHERHADAFGERRARVAEVEVEATAGRIGARAEELDDGLGGEPAALGACGSAIGPDRECEREPRDQERRDRHEETRVHESRVRQRAAVVAGSQEPANARLTRTRHVSRIGLVTTGPVLHWDDARTWRGERGHIAGTWWSLTGRASRTVGVKRIQVDPGQWSTPLHLEGQEEEIFYVLGGSGRSVQWEGEEELDALPSYEVGPGDCIVHLALENAHTLQAGPDGLDVLAFGQRLPAGGVTWLPRAGVAWLGETWAPVGAEDDHPWKREADAGPAPLGDPAPRPANIVNVDDVAAAERHGDTVGRRVRNLGQAAGSLRTGLRHSEVLPGKLSAPPHCHSAEEEIFVVLEGEGALLLWEGDGVAEHPVRAGSVVCRQAGTGVAHAFRGGANGLTVLMYGTREPSDLCYYPRSGKVFFTGLGLVTRVEEPLDYWDGED
jgi:uncharacterized cupin superfamily protein